MYSIYYFPSGKSQCRCSAMKKTAYISICHTVLGPEALYYVLSINISWILCSEEQFGELPLREVSLNLTYLFLVSRKEFPQYKTRILNSTYLVWFPWNLLYFKKSFLDRTKRNKGRIFYGPWDMCGMFSTLCTSEWSS